MRFKLSEKLFLKLLQSVSKKLMINKKQKHHRILPFGSYFIDRWDKAKLLGFEEGVSVYDNVVVIGSVSCGKNSWIGPNVVLDGAGGLEIGCNCSISAGVQIYSHDSIDWAISGGKKSYQYAKTKIGNHCYIGPNTIIQKGVTIGDRVIVGANSYVNRDIPSDRKAVGSPVRFVGQEVSL